MAEFKLTIANPKKGKSYQREVKDQEASVFLGKKIGDTIKGELINLTGYEFKITGGSDYCGFPMRKDVRGTGRKKILAVMGVGLKKKGKGQRQRKTVCGNTIHDNISQINLLTTVEGKQPLETEAPKEAKTEEKQEPKEEPVKKEEPKKEEPKEVKKEEKPEEEKKEKVPKEEPKKTEETKEQSK